ncbi:hypothetical protein LX64_02892 [Chitinophaga skermanii]|uniref:Uncharacterized protein n=1 Tax=Chitinophaga skermanii TaxID=331697 RepID=A0A327QJ46_9BACT|nr:hypothetical protein [Chitinophaga skermanii]RAJ04015.1 hypothetical protein LX64_02892 [Chitinophaga skermanii]
MKKLLFLLLLTSVTVTSALASDGIKNEKEKGANNGEKGANNGDKDKEKSEKASTKVVTKTSSKVEEFVWSLPREIDKVDENDMENALIDLYKWYLQNETKVNTNMQQRKDAGKDIAIPFKVDPKVLQQYLQFIKKNFPGLNTEDLNKRTSAFRKSLEPVSNRDDMSSNIMFSGK